MLENNLNKSNVCYFLFLFLFVIVSFSFADDPDRIKPYIQNPHYWQYNGSFVLLLGGSKDDNLFQISGLESHLDEMTAIGANYIRNTMSDRDSGNARAFKELAGGEYDLNQWDNLYWDKFRNLLQWTKDRDIIIQIEVWDRFDHSRDQWLIDPYNPQNNINYTFAESGFAATYPDHPGQNKQPFFKTVPDMQNNTTVLQYQQKFVEKMLSYSLQYNHVLYCMDNETSADPEWGKYWDLFIKNKAAQVGITVETTEMWDAWDISSSMHKNTWDHPELYSFADISQNNHNTGQLHWDRIMYAIGYFDGNPRSPWPLNTVKIYGADGGAHGGGGDADAIEKFLRQILGGLAASRFHRPTSGIGLDNNAKACIKAGRKLNSVINFWEVIPRNDLLSNRADNEAYCAAKEGEQYALYFTSGGVINLNLGSYNTPFLLKWIKVSDGSWGNETTITGGSNITISAPGSGGWLAAIIQDKPAPSLGDVNSDGLVDIIDALLIAQYYVNLNPANFNISTADVDCNGIIDIIHALFIAQYCVGLLTILSC